MDNTWLSLMPPLIVMILAFVTKKLNESLIVGIVLAALIAADWAPAHTVALIADHTKHQIFDLDRIYLYLFLICISSLIVLLNRTGGAIAFAQAVTRRIHTVRKVEGASMGLSSALFIDDYLSNLTVGYVMRPLTDRFAIPRVKLAFLIHSMSGPLVILAPISSWVAMITTQLSQAGIAPEGTPSARVIGEPFLIYLKTIPFIFYSFLLIAGIIFIIYRRISYGPMYRFEHIAREENNMHGGKMAPAETVVQSAQAHATSFDLIIPLITLVAAVIGGILYVGGYHLLGGSHTFVEALKHNNQTPLILFSAGLITLLVSIVLTFSRRTLTLSQIPGIIRDGIVLMYPAIIMIILASILGEFLSVDLKTGIYLATTILKSAPLALLPLLFFIVSAIMGIITGSSWGTIALLVPVGIQMVTTLIDMQLPVYPEQIHILFPLIGAIFSGAVCGDHVSPFSETTIMAATSAGTYPIDHAQTQFPYALPAIIGSAVAFLVAGFLAPMGSFITVIASASIGILVTLALLSAANAHRKQTHKHI